MEFELPRGKFIEALGSGETDSLIETGLKYFKTVERLEGPSTERFGQMVEVFWKSLGSILGGVEGINWEVVRTCLVENQQFSIAGTCRIETIGPSQNDLQVSTHYNSSGPCFPSEVIMPREKRTVFSGSLELTNFLLETFLNRSVEFTVKFEPGGDYDLFFVINNVIFFAHTRDIYDFFLSTWVATSLGTSLIAVGTWHNICRWNKGVSERPIPVDPPPEGEVFMSRHYRHPGRNHRSQIFKVDELGIARYLGVWEFDRYQIKRGQERSKGMADTSDVAIYDVFVHRLGMKSLYLEALKEDTEHFENFVPAIEKPVSAFDTQVRATWKVVSGILARLGKTSTVEASGLINWSQVGDNIFFCGLSGYVYREAVVDSAAQWGINIKEHYPDSIIDEKALRPLRESAIEGLASYISQQFTRSTTAVHFGMWWERGDLSLALNRLGLTVLSGDRMVLYVREKSADLAYPILTIGLFISIRDSVLNFPKVIEDIGFNPILAVREIYPGLWSVYRVNKRGLATFFGVVDSQGRTLDYANLDSTSFSIQGVIKEAAGLK